MFYERFVISVNQWRDREFESTIFQITFTSNIDFRFNLTIDHHFLSAGQTCIHNHNAGTAVIEAMNLAHKKQEELR